MTVDEAIHALKTYPDPVYLSTEEEAEQVAEHFVIKYGADVWRTESGRWGVQTWIPELED